MTQQKKFIKYIIKLDNDIKAYYRPCQKTSHVCIVIHQHVGLVQSLIQTVQNIIGRKISIFIPDLFSGLIEQKQNTNQFYAVQKLKFSTISQIIQKSINYVQRNHSGIFLIGFSIGAAYGWKILQKYHNFKFSCLFYGLPDVKQMNPTKIKTKTYIFSGSNDKIKYLSDQQTFQKVVEKSQANENLIFQKLSGLGHGFLNPDSQNFSEVGLKYCQKIVFTQLPPNLVDHNDKKLKVQDEKKQSDSGCSIY